MDNDYFLLCVLTYAIIHVLIHQIIFRFYILRYSLFFSSALVLTSSIDVVFILSTVIRETYIVVWALTNMWRVKFRAVPSQYRGILWCSAWVRFSNWIWNQGPKYSRARKPNPSRQTNLKPIRHGLSKVLLNIYKFRRNDKKSHKKVCVLRKQYIRRITIATFNHLQDGVCHHCCCRWPGPKLAPGHQQPPCCKYQLFTRFHWKLICEDNRIYAYICTLW